MKAIRKIRLDNAHAMQVHQEAASSAAVNKFAAAEAITKLLPHGLATPAESLAAGPQESNGPVASTPQVVSGLVASAGAFDLAVCVPGVIVRVPLHLIDTNPLSPRQIYTGEEIDKIAKTLPGGQDVAAHGYVANGRRANAQIAKERAFRSSEIARELERYRQKMARQLSWKTYMVFQRKTIQAIDQQRPKTAAALAKIPGMGPAKIARFGNDILEMIRRHA